MRTGIRAALTAVVIAAVLLPMTAAVPAGAAPAGIGPTAITLQAGYDVVGNNCAASSPAKIVAPGTAVEVCFTVNTPFTGYTNLVVGLNMTTEIFNGPPTFPQSGSGGAVVAPVGFTNTRVRAVATDGGKGMSEAIADIAVIGNPLALVKTVGTEPGVCATTDTVSVLPGTTVHYCYRASNAFTDRPLEVSILADDKNPAVDVTDLPATTIPPGGSIQAIVPQQIFATGTNVGTVCASETDVRGAAVPAACAERYLATDTASVTVLTPAPSLSLVSTVGTDPASCATTQTISVPAGTTVHFCHTATNTGNVTFTRHDLADSVAGTLLAGFPFALPPGASVNSVAAGASSSTVVTGNITNTATWTASTDLPDPPTTATQAAVTVTATATAGATVTLQVPPTTPTPIPTPAVGNVGATPTPTPLPVPVAKKAAPVPAKNLAFTGAEPGVLVIVGVSLVIAGALVLTTFRRRPE